MLKVNIVFVSIYYGGLQSHFSALESIKDLLGCFWATGFQSSFWISKVILDVIFILCGYEAKLF